MLRKWEDKWGRRNIVVECDNLNSVRALNSGASRDKVIQAVLRNIHWVCVEHSLLVRVVWVQRINNTGADFLSRRGMGRNWKQKCDDWIQQQSLKLIEVDREYFQLKEC